jgi:hypothetical protein
MIAQFPMGINPAPVLTETHANSLIPLIQIPSTLSPKLDIDFSILSNLLTDYFQPVL